MVWREKQGYMVITFFHLRVQNFHPVSARQLFALYTLNSHPLKKAGEGHYSPK
jgi:hypothetical protein